MRLLPILFIAFFASCAVGAETKFSAYMVMKEQPFFTIDVDGAASGWLPLGGKFHDCRISAFDPKTEILTVENSGAKQSLPLKASKVGAAAVDLNEPLRTLKGLPLAYEVARRGDENTRGMLLRYQEALASGSRDKTQQDALEFLRSQVERVAANGAQRFLSEPQNQAPLPTATSGTPRAEPRVAPAASAAGR